METTYHINRATRTALVRITETACQEWQALGQNVGYEAEFDHRHRQSIYPTKERLDEYIQKNFEPSTKEEYLAIQFEHHQYDDYFRGKANAVKQKQYEQLSTNN